MKVRVFCLTLISVGLVFDVSTALAVDPSPLQSAYWRFEEGTAGTNVPTGPDTVLDSINANHMQTASTSTAPLYTSNVPAAIIPRTGAANNLAMRFTPNQDVFTAGGAGGKPINHPITTAFTLEAAFMPASLNRFQAIVGKDGKPTAMLEQTLALKVRGDTNVLQIELFDAVGTLRQVSSMAPLAADQWYYAAAVNDGSNLSLYLDRNDGAGYVLQGSTPVNGALFQNESSWTIGRGMHNNNPTDFFDGFIDEVRLSNTALSPTQFLFYIPEPGSGTLALLAFAGLAWRRGGRPRRI